MDTEILWILMITNILNNYSKLLKKLGLSQNEFLKYSSYAAKSSLKRVTEGDGRSIAEVTQIIKKELDQRVKDAFSKKSITVNEQTDAEILTCATSDYYALRAWAELEEKFVESMVIAIDSYIFFKKPPKDVIDEITTLALYNDISISNEQIYLAEQHRSHKSIRKYDEEESWKERVALIFADEDTSSDEAESSPDDKYAILSKQYWYQIKYSVGKGLTYQLQYFKYYKASGSETFRSKPVFDVIKQNRKDAFLIISGAGFVTLKPYLYSILSTLQDSDWGIGTWETLRKNSDLKFMLPEAGLYQLYYDISPDAELGNYCDLLPKSYDNSDSADDSDESSATYGYWSDGLTPAQREIHSIQSWFQLLHEKLPSMFVLLFVSGPGEMRRLAKMMDPDFYQQMVFAYPAQSTPEEDSSDKHLYICFSRGQDIYSYALKIECEED